MRRIRVHFIGTKGNSGFADGTKAFFNYPFGIHFSKYHRVLIVSDYFNNKLRKVLLHNGFIVSFNIDSFLILNALRICVHYLQY